MPSPSTAATSTASIEWLWGRNLLNLSRNFFSRMGFGRLLQCLTYRRCSCNCSILSHFSLIAYQSFDKTLQRKTYYLFVRFFKCHPHFCHSVLIQFSKDGRVKEALKYFDQMNKFGVRPTKFTLCTILSCCSKVLDYQFGLQIHAQIILIGYEGNMFLSSVLVDLYAKCGSMVHARRVFDEMEEHDQVSMTSIIFGLCHNGHGKEALVFFKGMLESDDIKPNCFTFTSLISSCTCLESGYEQGTLLHAQVLKRGFEVNSFVISSLIDVYAKCGEINHAKAVFYASRERDIILYNSMIAGFSRNLHCEEALRLLIELQKNEMAPTDFTLSSVLNACGALAILQQGTQIHSLIIKMGSNQNVYVLCALIDMYSKCGSVDDARRIFDHVVERNNILWTSMITGYAQNGRGDDGIALFEELLKEGARLDHICFTSVLTACNHAGLLDQGIHYFNLMKNEYGLRPEVDQYACLIDLYGRNGHLRRAKGLMAEMPFEPNTVIWSSFLRSCQVYDEVELGKEAAYQLLKMEPYNCAPYLTLASMFARAGMWVETAEVRRLMECRELRRRSAWSKVEME